MKHLHFTPNGVVETDIPDRVPSMVTNANARRALIRAGKFDDANAAAVAAGGEAYQMWEYANHFYRDDPILISLAYGIGLSDAEIDALFVNADAIT